MHSLWKMYFLLKTGDIPASHMLVYLEGIFFCRCPHHLGYFGHKSVLVGRSAAFSLAKAGCVGISLWTSWCRAFLLRLGVQQLGAEDRVRCQRLDSSKITHRKWVTKAKWEGEPKHTKFWEGMFIWRIFLEEYGDFFVGKNLMFNVFFMVRNG